MASNVIFWKVLIEFSTLTVFPQDALIGFFALFRHLWIFVYKMPKFSNLTLKVSKIMSDLKSAPSK